LGSSPWVGIAGEDDLDAPDLVAQTGQAPGPKEAKTSKQNGRMNGDGPAVSRTPVRRGSTHPLPAMVTLEPDTSVALAARIMLKRRGVDSVLHFGARIGQDKPIDAHAWLDAAGVEVTGYPVANTFAEIACFV
jgi:hypothetical protein